MQQGKRFFALFLTAVLVLTMVPFGVSATCSHPVATYVAIDDETHSMQCSDTECGAKADQEHDFSDWSADAAQHSHTCALCFRTVSGPHAYSSLEKVNDDTHKGTCTICGKEVTTSHTGLTWTSADDFEHQATCAGCGGLITKAHEITTYTYDDADYHKGTCPVCSETLSYRHNDSNGTYTKVDDLKDKAKCSDCGQDLEYAHDYVFTSVDASQHKAVCSKCGNTVTSAHSTLTWSKEDDSEHKATCERCGTVTAEHTITWSAADDDGKHVGVCSVCGGGFEISHSGLTWAKTNNSTHSAECPACGSISQGHDITFAPVDAAKHKGTCTICSGEVITAHSTLTWTMVDAATHEAECDDCGTVTSGHICTTYEQYNHDQHKSKCTVCKEYLYIDHTFTYTSTGTAHTPTCSDCGFIGEAEAHNIVDGTCSVCGTTVYTVSFDANGATSGIMPDQDMPVGEAAALNANKFKRPTYYFDCWNTKADGSGLSYANKASVTDIDSGTGSVKLYAQWKQILYNVAFDANGGSGTMSTLNNRKGGVSFTLTANAFERKGYTFTGWNTKADGSGTGYSNKDIVVDLANTGTVTLYAQWKANTYYIVYYGNGATSGGMEKQTMKYGKTYNLTANLFKRSGYTFNGWNTLADGTGKQYANQASVSNLTATSGKTIKLYATWILSKYNIAFDANGGTGTMSPMTGCKVNESYTLTANAFKRTGYTFTGWNTKADGTGKTYANKASVSNLSTKNGKTVTLYAQWKLNTYSIAFNGNKSTSGSMSTLTAKKYGTSYTLPTNAFKRTGYTFTGWNTKADGTGTTYTNGASVKNLTTKNGVTVTLYAQWKVNKYTITFNGNKATSGSMSDVSGVKYTTKVTLDANTFKRTGYSFAGWNTKADGTGTQYANKAEVSKLCSKNNGTATLYAQWKGVAYTITLTANKGTGSNKTLNATYGTALTLPGNTFSRKGYTFIGWNTKADGTGAAYTNKDSVKNLTATKGGNVVLYAQWKKS